MKINFIDCFDIDKKLMRKAIWKNFLYYRYKKDRQLLNEIRKWDIMIYPVNYSKVFEQFFSHILGKMSKNIPWGHTGKYVISLFINDMKGDMIFLQNMKMISHEIAHAVLANYYDWDSSKFVKIVHDAQKNSKIIIIHVHHRLRKKRFVILDISEFTDQINKNKDKSPFLF